MTDQIRPRLEHVVPQASALPQDPESLVRINGAAQVVAGLALATGRMPRLSSSVLAADAGADHGRRAPLLGGDRPGARTNQQIHFFKNLSMLGGLILAAVDTEGRPDWPGAPATAPVPRAARPSTCAVRPSWPRSRSSGSAELPSTPAGPGRTAVASRGERDRTSGRPRRPAARWTREVVAARLEVAHQPRAGAGRAGRRPGRRTPCAALARHRADGRGADRARRRRRHRRRRLARDAAARSRPARGRLRPGRHGDALRAAGRRPRGRAGSTSTATRTPAPGRWPRVLGALRGLGRRRSTTTTAARCPFTVDGTGSVRGGTVVIDASASSQFVSALLLAGARYDEGVDVRHDGKPVPSLPHIEMTVALPARARRRRRRRASRTAGAVAPGPIARGRRDDRARPVQRGAVPDARPHQRRHASRVPGWPRETTQAGDALRDILDPDGRRRSPSTTTA